MNVPWGGEGLAGRSSNLFLSAPATEGIVWFVFKSAGGALPYINLANVRLKQGRFEEAIESYHEAQMLRPDYEMTHYDLGVAYFQQGHWAKAAGEWRRTLQLKPNFPEARQSLEAVRDKMTLQ